MNSESGDNKSPRKTPFYKNHLEAGARMVEFAGCMMPIQYAGIAAEHLTVRKNIGIFDLSHMGEFMLSGNDAEENINRLTTNNVKTLSVYQAQYSCMCYENGGIVDDLLVYKYPDKFMLVVNASNREKDFLWISRHLEGDVTLSDETDGIALLAIQGPDSEKLLSRLTDINLPSINFYWFTEGTVLGVPMTVSRTGYTGEDGFELYFDGRYGYDVWNRVFEAGKAFGTLPVGLGARDTLRLEMKYALYGNDIDAGTNPLEAGLGFIVKMDKGDFIGKNALMNESSRKLVCLRLEGRRIARHGFKLYKDNQEVGEIRSGTLSPSMSQSIATAYIKKELSKTGTEVQVDIRGNMNNAVIVKPPFYRQGTHK